MLWNFSLYSDHNHSSNHPNIVLLDYQQRIIYFMEISCPADVRKCSIERGREVVEA